MDTLRVASIGTGTIVDWFLEAVAEVDEVSYVGCYSRTLEKAREWGEPRGAQLFFDGMDNLAASSEIDAVYVASPNSLHAKHAQLMLAAGKHVLAEKPLSANLKEARAAFDSAHENKVVLMEAMRTLHMPGFAAVCEHVTELGEICTATFRFSKVSSRVPALKAGQLTNTFNPAMAGSALLDIGVYCVSPMVHLWGAPKRVMTAGTVFDVAGIGGDERWSQVDLSGEALCDYGDFCVNLSWGKVSDNHIASQIQGTEATLLIENLDMMDELSMVRPVSGGAYGAYGSGEGVAEKLSYPTEGSLLADELRDFAQACAGNTEIAQTYERTSKDALAVMDEIRSQLGVQFPADED